MKYIIFATYLLFLCGEAQVNAQLYTINTTKKINTYLKIQHKFSFNNTDLEIAHFIINNKLINNLEKFSLNKLYSTHSPLGYHIHYQQLWNGIPVQDGGVKLNLDKEGNSISCLNHLITLPSLPINTIQYQLDSAFLFIQNNFEGEIRNKDTCMYFYENNLYYTFRFITTKDPHWGGLTIWVNAQDGAILGFRKRSSGNTPPRRDAQGYCFIPDPLTSSRQFFSVQSPYVDNNNSTNSFLDAERRSVTLKDLLFDEPNQTWHLQGPKVEIVDITPPTIAPVTSKTGTFYFDRSQNGFEDVNAYFHGDAFMRYIESLGFDSLHAFPVKIDTHGDFRDNSFFTPEDSSGYITMGIGGVDDAEDADVVVHEIGHALSNAASQNTNTGFERRALDEAVGDYIAAFWSGRFSNFRRDEIYTWDGHNNFWGGRVTNNTKSYTQVSQSSTNLYDYGTVLASTLIRIHDRIGADNTLKLVLTELYFNVPNMSIQDAVFLYLDIENILYGGRFNKVLVEEFCKAELLPLSYCKTNAVQNNINNHDIVIYPNPASNYLYIQNKNEANQTIIVTIFNHLGQVVYDSFLSTEENKIDISILQNGFYLLKIVDYNNNKIFYKFTVIK